MILLKSCSGHPFVGDVIKQAKSYSHRTHPTKHFTRVHQSERNGHNLKLRFSMLIHLLLNFKERKTFNSRGNLKLYLMFIPGQLTRCSNHCAMHCSRECALMQMLFELIQQSPTLAVSEPR